jgi:ATP-dependent protease ClpP protease subunit
MPQSSQQRIVIDGLIVGGQAETVRAQLELFDRSIPISVEINSDGGSVQEGVTMFNLLRSWPGGCTVEITGWALSVATLVAMAGSRILAHPTSLLMVHAPWKDTSGNAGDLRQQAALLDQVVETMLAAYRRTGQSDDVIRGWLTDRQDHWFTAGEAHVAGLVDELISIESSPPTLFANVSARRHPLPSSVAARVQLTMPSTSSSMSPEAIRAEAVRAESLRRSEIRAMFESTRTMGDFSDLQRRCEDDPLCSPDQAGRLVLAELGRGVTPAAGPFAFVDTSVGSRRRDFVAAARDALLIRAGLRVAEPHPAVHDLSRMGVVAMAETVLSQMGRSTRGMSRDQVISAALTTSDFKDLLAGVTGKALSMGYNEAPATHVAWTAERNVPDFKTQTLVALSEAPDLERVLEHGEYTYGHFGDSASKFRVETFGRIVSLTRQALVNDDLSAFTELPNALGSAARRLEADESYSLLTSNPGLADGVELFHSGHGNVASVGSKPTTVSLGQARAAMRRQRGIAGRSFVDPQPRVLLVPVTLETWCEELLASLMSPTKGAESAPAWVRGLTLVSDPRLDEVSETAWYLVADPKQIPGIVRAYLAGEPRPFLEEFEEKKVDAASFKARLDFGTGVLDYRGLYKNPGDSA